MKPSIYSKIADAFDYTGEVLILLAKTVYWCKSAFKNLKPIAKQMLEMGVYTLPITSLILFLTGMVIAFQTGTELSKYHIQYLIGSIVSASMCREMGPVLTGLIVAGRVGASMTAELGTMQVSEEIDALKTLAINPIRYLVMPRFLACIIMLPILVIYSDCVGMAGGFIVSRFRIGVDTNTYLDSIKNYLTIKDIYSGLVKAFVFGIIISIVSCHQGFKTRGGAEGVGKSTTASVVVSFLLIAIFDYFLTSMFF